MARHGLFEGPLPCWKRCPGQYLTDVGVAQGLMLCPATVLGPLGDSKEKEYGLFPRRPSS